MGEWREFSGQVRLAPLEGRLQGGDELATKHASQYSNGKEEAWVGSNPAGVITGESTGGDNTVDMGMKLEFLVQGEELRLVLADVLRSQAIGEQWKCCANRSMKRM